MKVLLTILIIISCSFSQNYKPGDHELLFMPTANTMEAGQSYFSDYQLVFLNYTYAITDDLHISAFSLFPLATDFLETLSLGAKYKFIIRDNFKLAAFGTILFENSGFFGGGVGTISFGSQSSFSAALGVINAFDSDHNELIYMMGADFNISESMSFLLEYTNMKTLASLDFNGLISLGVRFRGENSSWEIGGFRPLEETDDDFLLFPVLKATFVF